MATKAVAYCEPDVLRWARESAGFSRRQAADEIGLERWHLEMVEDGNDYLTLREAEKAADVYQRPLAALFLPSPPEEEPQEVQFRRLPGTPEPPWGPALQLTARRVIERQIAALEIHEALDEHPPWIATAEHLRSASRESLAELVRSLIGVSRSEQSGWDSDAHAPFRGWRSAVETLGVLVMQAGPVPVEEMRGFASVEPAALPAILVNIKDDPRARAFTILHELGHIILALRGEIENTDAERWCDDFAGEVILPTRWLSDELGAMSEVPVPERVDAIASTFKVTPLAAAVRIARTRLLPREETDHAIDVIRSRQRETPKSKGGDYYRNQVAYFGPSYLGLVFSALDAQVVTLPTASSLLDGVKVKNFESLRDQLEGRR